MEELNNNHNYSYQEILLRVVEAVNNESARLFKEHLGDLRIPPIYKERIQHMIQIFQFALDRESTLPSAVFGKIMAGLKPLHQKLMDLWRVQDGDFANHQRRAGFMTDIDSSYTHLLENVPQLQAADPSFLDSMKLKSDVQDVISKAVADAVNTLEAKANALAEQTKNKSDEILGTARDTSAGVSLSGIKKIFEDNLTEIRTEEDQWFRRARTSIIVLLCAALVSISLSYILTTHDFQHGISHVAFLFLLSATTVIVVKIYRTKVHSRQTLQHNIRLANLVNALYNAGLESQSRDKLLLLVTEHIARHPQTGLIDEDTKHTASGGLTMDSLVKLINDGKGST
jgi:hypothetical protein